MIARARHPNGFDQALLAKMSKIAGAGIGWAIVMVSEITTGDHSKRADSRKRPRLRSAQGVLAVAITHQLTLQASRQFEIACERLAQIRGAVSRLAIALWPACIVAGISTVLVGIRLPRVTWTAPERARVLIIATS
jgi:hypothetical protein